MSCLIRICFLLVTHQAVSALEQSQSPADYVITLNETQNATIYCFSDYLPTLQLETEDCLECRRAVLQNTSCIRSDTTVVKPPECRCRDECENRERKCPFTAAEHSTCFTKVRSGEVSKRLMCTGLIARGGNLTITIQVVRHNGTRLCYGDQSGTPLSDLELVARNLKYKVPNTNDTYFRRQAKDSLKTVSYGTKVYCINASHVSTMTAGHLLSVGYTISSTPLSGHDQDHAEDKPEFENFCRTDRAKLWKKKEGFGLGAVFQCNGSYHILEEEFPCLQFPPVSTGRLKLPSLDTCSATQMVGIVVVMILAMVLCYTLLIACVKLWIFVCTCAKKEVIDIPLLHADSSTNSRTTLAGSVVKQESRDSMLSGVAPPNPPQPPLSEEQGAPRPAAPAPSLTNNQSEEQTSSS